MAANSSSTDGLAVLKNTPQAFSETLCQFRVCHDLCVYSDNKILDEEMQTKIDQCAVNFRHMSLQTTTLSDQVASVWCRTCILFFKNMSKIKGDPSKVLKKISDQARDLSEGFKGIGNWCRKLAGDFHDVGKMGDEKSKKYKESMERTKKEAEETMKSLKADLDKAATEAEKERKRAKKWLIAAAIPVVNLVAGAGAIVTSQWASDAESLQRDAQRKSDEAKAELEKAASNSEKAEAMAKQIAILVKYLHEIEQMCEAIAAFWQLESDKFASFCPMVESVSDFFELGLTDEAAAEQIEWLEERKKELEKYHQVMSSVNSSFNFPTLLRPSLFPMIDLPTLHVTLQ